MKKFPDIRKFPRERIRNFSIIAHVDHGKSTLADRMLEITKTVDTRQRLEQALDKLEVERERGITVKAQTATLIYEKDGKEYLLNLIDTPGHVDFSYEVSRALAACEGVLLLVDASQGIQAQTMANFYLAFEQDLTIIPVLNKVDMAIADPERVLREIEHAFGLEPAEALMVSAKTGLGVKEVLDAIVERIPAPREGTTEPRALLFDSWYDEYRGVICLVKVTDGEFKKGEKVKSLFTGEEYELLDVGVMHPEPVPTGVLTEGSVGYLITGMKSVREARVGDTFALRGSRVEPLPGFKPAKAMVFAGIYPVDSDKFEELSDAIEKLTLNDPSVSVAKEASAALGLGFRCGFLGLLHLDIFKQRLEKEYGLEVITTAPTVLYRVKLKSGETLMLENPSEFPDPSKIDSIEEPVVDATIITPQRYLGALMQLCQERRGVQRNISYIDEDRVVLTYRLPLNEIVVDFYDKIKSLSAGYASFDYEDAGYEKSNLVKMDILINGKPVDALSVIVHKERAYYLGRALVSKLRRVIHRQLFEVAIQAAIGSRVIARETVKALRKDVTAKCYGGDITRKRKLLEKQKEGKKKMKVVGRVELPQEAFLAVLSTDED